LVSNKRSATLFGGDKSIGIVLGDLKQNRSSEISLEGYCDADFATNKETKRSRTGYLFMVNGSITDWRSQLQSAESTSTAKAKYMSLAECVKNALLLRTMFVELLGKSITTTTHIL